MGRAETGGDLLHRWEGEPVELWRDRWRVSRLEIHASLESTNDRVREVAAAGALPGLVVLAEEQTAGRGRSGKAWHSSAGLGLWLSILLPASREGERGGDPVLPLRAGLVTARAVEAVAPRVRVGVEWPNDLVIEGRKVGGILCEDPGLGSAAGVVVGVGLNVEHGPKDFPAELRARAGSLRMAGVPTGRRARLAGEVIRRLRGLGPGAGRLSEEEREELAVRDTFRGRRVEGSAGIRGVAAGITPSGSLRVDVGGRLVEIRAGSVRALSVGALRPGRGGEEAPAS